MFKLRRFRKKILKYEYALIHYPQIIKNDIDFHVKSLSNLSNDIQDYMDKKSNNLSIFCNLESKLATIQSSTINKPFLFILQIIVDWFYDNILYSIETASDYDYIINGLIKRCEQIKYFKKNDSSC